MECSFPGNSGATVLLYDPKNSHVISLIENEFGVKFERITAPQPVEVAQISGKAATHAISRMPDRYIIKVLFSQCNFIESNSVVIFFNSLPTLIHYHTVLFQYSSRKLNIF